MSAVLTVAKAPSLASRVDSAILDGPSPDPAVIARRLLDSLSDDELRDALAFTLPMYVQARVNRAVTASAATRNGGSGVRSDRKAAAEAAVRGFLGRPVFPANGWKRLGECGVTDLAQLASARQRQASDILAAAARFEKYSAALQEHGVQTVAELPAPVLLGFAAGDGS